MRHPEKKILKMGVVIGIVRDVARAASMWLGKSKLFLITF